MRLPPLFSRSRLTSFSIRRVYRNAIIRSKTDRKNYVADELDECLDYGGLMFRLAFERVSRRRGVLFCGWVAEELKGRELILERRGRAVNLNAALVVEGTRRREQWH
jgi:hypothetical protein